MTVVRIARCPEHGLHGDRQWCFVCGGDVDQVPMVPAEELEKALDRVRLLEHAASDVLEVAETLRLTTNRGRLGTALVALRDLVAPAAEEG